MRITRAAKVAAFPLTALILVALVACQGPVGGKGPQGADGPSGPSGPSGPAGGDGPDGPQGFSALKTIGPAAAVDPIIVNDVVGDDDATIGAMPPPKDVSTYFSGGKPDITYTVAPKGVMAVTDVFTYTATIEKGSMMLMIAVAEGKTAPRDDGHDYSSGETNTSVFTITATDADKLMAYKDVEVLSNSAPQRGTAANFEMFVGNQNAADEARKAADGELITPKCATFNTCAGSPRTMDVNRVAESDFADHNPDDLTFSAVSTDPRVTASVAGKMVVVTGVTSTWDAKAEPEAHDPVTVTVTATDKGGLSETRELAVLVDGAPEIETAMVSAVELKKNAMTGTEVVSDLAGFFKDAEDDFQGGAELEFTAKSSNMAVASVLDTVITDLVVTPANIGTATITVTATDSRDQTATQTITVTVTL